MGNLFHLTLRHSSDDLLGFQACIPRPPQVLTCRAKRGFSGNTGQDTVPAEQIVQTKKETHLVLGEISTLAHGMDTEHEAALYRGYKCLGDEGMKRWVALDGRRSLLAAMITCQSL